MSVARLRRARRRHLELHGRGGRLHGRIFRWFGASIVVTGLLVFLAFHYLGDGGAWSKERARVEAFVAGQLGAVWEDPEARRAFVLAMARDLELDVVLRDAEGRTLEASGRCELARHTVEVPGRGVLVVCPRPNRWGSPLRLPLAILVAVAAIWAASGRVARRIARPIVHLAQVARDLGDGKLESRARLDCRELGEIGVLTSAINDMAAKLERQVREQRELLATVSHELRTPLGHVRLITELLEGRADPERLAQLEREVMEMDRLVAELLAGARVDFSALRPRRLDVAALAREGLSRLGLPVERLRVEVSDAHVEADATLLMRAITNLVENAERHGRGLEALVIKRRPGWVTVEAEDRGPGFSAVELERAFEPFQRRAGTAGDDGRSLGLGLSLVRRIAEAHRGAAHARNRPGAGAVVGLDLPA